MVSLSRIAAVLTVPLCCSCTDETLSGYAGTKVEYVLQALDDRPFAARATLSFPKPGQIAGQAPCNRYFGSLDVPYPWFKGEGLVATEMACPDLAAEGAFFAALAEMTFAEVSGKVLILSNGTGREMVFKAP